MRCSVVYVSVTATVHACCFGSGGRTALKAAQVSRWRVRNPRRRKRKGRNSQRRKRKCWNSCRRKVQTGKFLPERMKEQFTISLAAYLWAWKTCEDELLFINYGARWWGGVGGVLGGCGGGAGEPSWIIVVRRAGRRGFCCLDAADVQRYLYCFFFLPPSWRCGANTGLRRRNAHPGCDAAGV